MTLRNSLRYELRRVGSVMLLSIKKTADITGLSIRALHYYDEIGLLKPSRITDAGYRQYDNDAISLLMQIMFFKELGFPLKEIIKMMKNPDYDNKEALEKHKQLLMLRKKHIESLIELTDQTLGGKEMNSQNEVLQEYENARKQYADEAEKKWGHTKAYKQSVKKHTAYSDKDKVDMMNEAEEIFNEFANNIGTDPADEKVQKLVKRWQEHITRYSYDCTKEILSGLALMYMEDERFKRISTDTGKVPQN
jgi:DNA-binding transcriptional MerR regulator